MVPEKAVILAAGLGTRLGKLTEETPKGLLKVAGREILYRTMKVLQELGVREFIIITNPKYETKFRKFAEKNGFNARIIIIINEHPEKGNGYSLYLAKDWVDGRFILVMSDHIYERAFLVKAAKGEGLIVDEAPRYISIDEATKVKIKDRHVEDLGKHLKEFDAIDTGFFVLTPEIFEVADEILSEKGKAELSEIVKRAKLKVTFVSGFFWMDIDTPEDIKKARKLIVQTSIKGKGDGFISRHLNRKISTRISTLLVDHVTPDQMTVVTFLLGILSALVNFISISLAGILYQISSILDGVDGEIARASMKTSRFGGYVDSILDRYVDFAFLLILAYVTIKEPLWWAIAVTAIFGSAMVSYSTERYKAAYGSDIYKEISTMRYLIGKRDERIFLTMLFCLAGQIKALFTLLAILTNLRIAATMYLVWKNKRG
ncbi:CDP-alcohol phosphatidyltransferase [Thermococcus sp. M39]|uniref:bifunctional L-myo-inositol-1-phosphate cytidylyltransferase/CDP-L-myo-inositol myo-inositolphosphotransferase n=1 Tax=unclassified Thermococcus TaxID=2627626 RepID=UPI00143A3B5A|nr:MULTISPECIES: bifunctional L-myo-inositol-1-phosphate cytidylyltransferase/CDP-L-myo-inositol myo-inositolphosphotransferase [unclassified Thermococcus]NJE08008.1 CDP-alcohol phosphatidyltransferase [Thermococcus sp. M39]NJE13804.1 CDP-alcohol phosphatidyltransferase [Thermococcus sp. LS2]